MRDAIASWVPALLLLSTPVARAEGASPAPPKLEPPAALDLTPRPKPALDFLLLEEKPLGRAGDPAFDAKVAQRRTLLNVHQAAGLATWALMGTTVVVGQLNYRDLYGGGGYTQKYRNAHLALAASTATAFAFTGILALSAPEPYVKRMRLDTATVHKGSMAVTTLGLVAQIALGVWANRSSGHANQGEIAAAHQIVGYATFGAMTIGAVTLLF